MDKQKKEQIILLIAVVFLVIMLPRVFKKGEASPRAPKPLPMQLGHAGDFDIIEQADRYEKEAAAVAPEVKPAEEQPAFNENLDPFSVPVDLIEKMKRSSMLIESSEYSYDDPNSPKIDLQGIVWGSDAPIAFIDNKAYKKGDAVGDAQIIDIDKKGVYLLYNGERVLVRMKKQI